MKMINFLEVDPDDWYWVEYLAPGNPKTQRGRVKSDSILHAKRIHETIHPGTKSVEAQKIFSAGEVDLLNQIVVVIK